MIIKKSEKDERREKIIDVAFRLFVNKNAFFKNFVAF